MRRHGMLSALNQLARAAAKAQREAERKQKARQREVERQVRLQRQYERKIIQEREKAVRQSVKEQKAFEKEQKIRYLESRKSETSDLNDEIKFVLEEFQDILAETLSRDDTILFKSLYRVDSFPKFVPPSPKTVPQLTMPLRESFFQNVPTKPSLLEKTLGIGKKNRLEAMAATDRRYQFALEEYNKQKAINENIELENARLLKEARDHYDKEKTAFENEKNRHNQEIDDFKDHYFSGDKDAVESYNSMVLERSNYSDLFPQDFELYYVTDSKELVIKYELPSYQAIPMYKEYKYIQTKDEIRGIEFKQKEKTEIYSHLVASVALRTLHEIFEADQAKLIHSIVFNGSVSSVDPRTGLDVQPCIITVQSKKEEFMRFDLRKVDVVECVKGLRAQISPSLSDLAPVKPIVNFDMLDRRFVDEKDMLSTIDDRTNLLEMDPFDFEHLICNLFSKIGLEAKLTRSSRDGGVDVVAFDPRPVFGGKYVIQAKRYKNTVEVAAVRDLYGTMMNENAAKGILVTTSSFGSDARGFAKDKPIELIDGANLLYMLEQNGIHAKIVHPNS